MPGHVKRRDFLIGASALSAVGATLTAAHAAESTSRSPRKTILVIGAHYDDCEIGAGGLIFKAVKRGHRVVLLNVVGNYSTWYVTQGREARIREQNVAQARAMGVEKRYLDYGYQQVTENLQTLRKLAEVVVDVKPDITLFHDRHERERAPSDHGTVGALAEQAVRNADTILDGLSVSYGKEMYAYEVDPQREFRPDVFIDIGDVLPSVIETINFFRKLNAESPRGQNAGRIEATVKINPNGPELPLTAWAEIKLCTARFRGHQGGVRFAEAYKSLDGHVIGNRLLQQIVQ
jgi:LmbE family N-acetylglucosaminyl deacetylase